MHKIYVSNPEFAKFDQRLKEDLLNLGWQVNFNNLGRLLNKEELIDYAAGCHALIAGTEDLSGLVAKSSTLQLISKIGVGVDNIPLNLCQDKGIAVNYTPDAVTDATAQLAMGMILNVIRHISKANQNIKSGLWERLVGRQISEIIIGIIGWGRVGQKLTCLLENFKPAQILVYDILDKSKQIAKFKKSINIEQVTLEKLLCNIDVLSLHADLNPSSYHIINENRLNLIKPTSYIINVARGKLIDEAALLDALKSNKLAAAAIDVYEQEPYVGPLSQMPNVIQTCHMGSFTVKARNDMDRQGVLAVKKFFQKKPLPNPVPIAEYIKQKTNQK